MVDDAASFEAFVREYQDMVFATAVRLLGREAEAEDVAQTVFLRAFERFETLGASPSAAGWLKTVTTNLCLNHLTRYRARWQLFSELDVRDAADTRCQPVVLPDSSTLERAEQQRRLEHAIRLLPDHQRVPLVLYHFEELSYAAIAEVLGVSAGKVKTDIHRARQALKRQLAAWYGPR